MRHPRSFRGFSLLEVLIAVLIFSLGLLGLAALLVLSVKTNHSAYLRTQASFLAQSMADRMRANSRSIWAGDYNDDAYPVTATAPACDDSAPCSFSSTATRDKAIWSAQLQDSLPAAAGKIACERNSSITVTNFAGRPPYDGLCTITLSWSESSLEAGGSASTQTFVWKFQP